MVFGLFKKKKKTPPAQPQTQVQDPHLVEHPAPELVEKPHISKESKTNKNKSPAVDSRDDQWMYEYVAQFLRSPLWKIPILSFLDENCIIFDEDEANNEEHLQAHEDFKKLVQGLMTDLMNELEIAEERMTEIVQIGLRNPRDKKYFERLLVAENFKVFKNQMIKRNKQLEIEALQQLHEMERIRPSHEGDHIQEENSRSLQKLTLEKEQAEIEHALALSLAVEEERRKLEDQEDYEMQEALRQSQAEFTTYQEGEREKERQKEREIARELERQKQRQRELEEQEARARAQAEAEAHEQVVHEDEPYEEEKVDPYKQMKSKRLEPLSNAPKPGHIEAEQRSSFLPPIHADSRYEPMSLDQLLQEKDKVGEEMKHEEKHTESLEERKKRLKAQRDLILAKKKAEREAELRNYEAKKEAIPNFTKEKQNEPAVSKEELEKRKEIYNKLKGEL